MKFILGKKVGMTTIYDKTGAQNVTLVSCEQNEVKLLRTIEKDGYNAVQLEMPKTKKIKIRREFKSNGKEMPKPGSKVEVSIFSLGEKVQISGLSKAKGFQGVVKRHGFKGAQKSHGHKHDLRAPGSIGATYPEHVIKGKRMAGRMGGARSTTKNIKIAYIDAEKNMLGLKGSVPGIPGSIIEVRSE